MLLKDRFPVVQKGLNNKTTSFKLAETLDLEP